MDPGQAELRLRRRSVPEPAMAAARRGVGVDVPGARLAARNDERRHGAPEHHAGPGPSDRRPPASRAARSDAGRGGANSGPDAWAATRVLPALGGQSERLASRVTDPRV